MAAYPIFIVDRYFIEMKGVNSMKEDIVTLILMGGENKRMGGNHKAFLEFQGESFLEKIVHEIAPFSPVVLSVNEAEKFNRLNNPVLANYPMIIDEVKGIGPMGGIYTALKELDYTYVFVTACDMPFMTAKLGEFMYEKIKALKPAPSALVLSDHEGKFSPLGGIYSKQLLPYIEEMIKNENYRLGKLLKISDAFILPISETPFNDDVLRNINTPDEYNGILL